MHTQVYGTLHWPGDRCVAMPGHEDGDGCPENHRVGTCRFLAKHNSFAQEDELIAYWVSDDREARRYQRWLDKRRPIVGEDFGAWGSRFDPVQRDQFMAQRPRYYYMGLAIDALRGVPVAVVRPAGTFTALYVNVSEVLRRVSKHKKRRALRYGRGTTPESQWAIDELCERAVDDWRDKHARTA